MLHWIKTAVDDGPNENTTVRVGHTSRWAHTLLGINSLCMHSLDINLLVACNLILLDLPKDDSSPNS